MNEASNSQSKPIIVVGAGIVGVSTAIWLQRDGHEVILFDKLGPGQGTSYGNGGVLAACGVVPVNSPGIIKSAPKMIFNPDSPLFLRWTYLPKMLPWLIRYLSRANQRDTQATGVALTNLLFDTLEQHENLAKNTGAEKWLKPSDYLFIYKDKAAFEKDSVTWSLRKKMGFVWDEMNSSEFEEYDPVFNGGDYYAIRLKNHGHITDPGKYVEELAAYFVKQGGKLVIGQVTDIEKSNGQLVAAKTSRGTIACSKLVLAAGIWSNNLAKKLGFKASMESERGYHIELINPSVMPRAPMMIASGKFVVTPMEGRIRCAGIVEFGGIDAPPSVAPFKLLKKQIHQMIPDLTYDGIEEWMGHRPAPSDSIPFIGPIKNTKGAFAAFGHHHIGLTGGPKTGRIIADMIGERKCNIDLAPYEVSRFT